MKIFLLLIPLLLLTGCDQFEKMPPSKINESEFFQVLEKGILNDARYTILLHKPTGKKIFAYSYSGMIYLPEPNAE